MTDTPDHWIIIAIVAVIILSGFGFIRLIRACDAANDIDWGGRWINRLDGLNRLFCRHFHRLQYETLKIPDKGGVIMVSNHVSGLDPLLLIAASKRPLRFMIAKSEYDRFGLTWLFRAVGCIPVARDRRVEGAFRSAVRALEAGEVLAMFPHGRIQLDSEPPIKLKAGAVKLAQMAGCPIYPVRIEGVLGKGMVILAPFLPSRARLYSLPPITCDQDETEQCLAKVANSISSPVVRG